MKISRIGTREELDGLMETSRQHPVWILKHSLTCSISGAALGEFRRYAAGIDDDEEIELGLLEIQNARPVSAEVERRTAVRHASPQAILLADGRPVWHASHWRISAAALAQAQCEHAPPRGRTAGA